MRRAALKEGGHGERKRGLVAAGRGRAHWFVSSWVGMAAVRCAGHGGSIVRSRPVYSSSSTLVHAAIAHCAYILSILSITFYKQDVIHSIESNF